MSGLDQIARLRAAVEEAVGRAGSTDELEQLRIRFLGRKAELPNLLRRVAELPPEERAATGRAANEVRRALEQAIEQRSQELAAGELQGRLEGDRVDVTLPPDPSPALGHLHLLT